LQKANIARQVRSPIAFHVIIIKYNIDK
jgi:hypothetical protein